MNDLKDKKEKLDIYTAIQLLALNNILHPSEDAFFNKLCRWYSKTFHTSLIIVKKSFSLEELLAVRYEEYYDNLSGEEMTKVKERLLYGKKQIEVEEEDDQFFENVQLDILKKQQKALDEKNGKKEEKPIEPPPADVFIQF